MEKISFDGDTFELLDGANNELESLLTAVGIPDFSFSSVSAQGLSGESFLFSFDSNVLIADSHFSNIDANVGSAIFYR